MNVHDPMGVVWTIVVLVGVFVSVARRMARTVADKQKDTALGRAVESMTPRNAPARPPAQAAARRRPPAQPVMPPVVPASARATLPPAAADDPFVGLGLIGEEPAAGPGPRRMSLAGGPPIGSRAWAANAVVAAEVLSPPVGLRGGATLGAQDAF